MLRQSVVPTLAVLAMLASGCTSRTDIGSSVPDRGDHAMVNGGGAPAAKSAAAPTDRRGRPLAETPPQGGQPGPGESMLTVAYGETLYQIADRYGVSLRWLIERNQLSRRARPGDRLIVPAHQR